MDKDEFNILFEDLSYANDSEFMNFFISFNQDSSSNESFEENNIYFSASNNNSSNESDILFNENYDEKNINEDDYVDENDYMNCCKINFGKAIEKLKNKKKEKKIKKFKNQLKIINYFKHQNEKIIDYINASERKKRKIMKLLNEKKQRMYKILLKRKIEKRNHLNINKNNFDFRYLLFFNQKFKTKMNIEKLVCSYLGKKRIKF